MERLDGMGYGCVLGPDVGKGTHHARLAGMDGARLWDGPVAQGEREIRSLYERAGRHGRVPLVVDQTGTVGSLPMTVALATGTDAAYLPVLAMRRS